MWSKASSSFALLLAVLAASASVSVSAQNAATGSDVLVTMPIQIDGSFKDLQLMRGESVEDAAVSFARDNGLLTNRDATRVREVVDQLSGLLRGRMEEIRATEPKPTVQLSMPLTIDGATRELKKLEGESVEAAVERYLYDGGYTMDVMRQLYPQLVNVVLQKLEELKPARKELFSFTLTIDGREAITRHFENGDPMEEARETLRGVDIVDATFVERLAPQIANEIRKRIPEASPAPAQPVAAQSEATSAQQPVAPPPANELFSIPLTVNERPTVLIHYEGYTSRESAVRYLNENGLANADTAAQMVTQLVQIIDTRIAEIARETQAAQEAAAARAKAEQEQQRVAALAAKEAAAAPRQPTVRLPVNFGNDQAATLDYYEGDSVERTVELFLTQIGMQESSTFAQNVEALAAAVRKELATIVAKREAAQATTSAPPLEQEPLPQQPQPLITLPVTLSGRVFDLVYFAGEQPATVANTFCVEKHEIIRTELGLQFDGDQLLECKTLLDQTLRNLIAQKQKEQPASPPPTHSRGEFLFSLDIELNNANVPLTMHQNDNAEQVARAFCEEHKIDLANVAPLVRALNEQLARLK